MFDLSHVNLWAVLVAALADMAIGYIWYSKAVFGSTWANLSGITLESNPNPAIYLVNLVLYLIMAYALAQVIFYFGIITAFAGAGLGLFLWVGFVLPTSAVENLFARRSWNLYAINYGYPLVAMAVMAMIIALWR